MSRFFIDRPVFAWVLAIVVMLAGALSLLRMPVEQYPTVAPVTVSIQATYPGASAEALENTVTQVIEQQMTGIDRLRSINSTSDAAGNVSLRLTFESGTNPDIAQVQVQNKLQLATARLPAEVQQRGIRVTRSSDDFLLVAGFVSQDGAQSAGDIADWLTTNLQDPISRVTGVGDVNVFGPQRAMRIWLDPDRMTSLGLTASDVRAAIRAQNAQVSAGRLGALPAVQGQQINATVVAQSRMRTPEQFGAILMRANPDGSQIRLRDIARVELGSETYEMVGRYNGKPAAGIAVKLATGANALTVADGVRERIASIAPPPGVEVVYPLDSTPFVKASIEGVVHTLVEAVVLVFLVMFLFLGNWRATLIPTIAVPVVLLGTFGILSVLGFSVNTLTMFALVLAIGLLVDDAIVVVENVERVMAEEGLDARAATRKSMGQISGALVGIGLVLSAVFIPMAFYPGSAGVIYRQFSVTIVSSMMLSVLVALVLTPALCAALLKPHKSAAEGHKPGLLGRALGGFNRGFERGTNAYGRGVGGLVRRPFRVMAIYAVILVALGITFVRLPSGFLPQEDKGQVFAIIQGPSGSTMDRTLATAERVEQHFLNGEKDAVEGVFSVLGFSFVGQGQNVGMVFVKLRDYEHRDGADLTAAAIAGRAMGAFAGLRDAMAFAITPPAVPGMGNSSGFDMQLVDRGGRGPAALTEARNRLLGMAARNPQLMGVRPNGLEDAPQLRVTIDPERAASLGLNISEVNDTLSAAWGSSYVDDFIDGARVKRVYIQADAAYRMLPEDIARWHVRSATGEMVPFSAFATTSWELGSPKLERFGGMGSRNIQGSPAPGVSTGEAMEAMEALVSQLSTEMGGGFGVEWTGASYEERQAGAGANALYALSILFVFLCLAALYESWAIPLSVILVVPLGVLGAVLAATATGLPSDVFFQVGLLVTIGLSAKNAILIVEFAKALREQGQSAGEAAVEAAKLRLRPIIMTSLAFGLGVTPLAIASGAGAAGQNAIGIGVLGGTVAATVLAILFVPVFFVIIAARTKAARPGEAGAAPEITHAPSHAPAAPQDTQP